MICSLSYSAIARMVSHCLISRLAPLLPDAAARLAMRSHLPSTERAHFSQYKSAKTLYDAVVARYSSPATAAGSRSFHSCDPDRRAAGAGGAAGAGVSTAARGTGAAGSGGATGAGATGGAGAGRAAGVNATGGTGARAAESSRGPAGAGAAGGIGAGGAAGAGALVGAGVGATGAAGGAPGAGGAAGVGANAGGAGAVPAGSGGATRPRPYFVPLLEQVLGLPPFLVLLLP
ncbi:unnamed protein product [Closterium sp. NIES-54]